jgi:hypothetical protein
MYPMYHVYYYLQKTQQWLCLPNTWHYNFLKTSTSFVKKEVNIFFNFTSEISLEMKNYVIWINKCYPQIKYNLTAKEKGTAVKQDYETA